MPSISLTKINYIFSQQDIDAIQKVVISQIVDELFCLPAKFRGFTEYEAEITVRVIPAYARCKAINFDKPKKYVVPPPPPTKIK